MCIFSPSLLGDTGSCRRRFLPTFLAFISTRASIRSSTYARPRECGLSSPQSRRGQDARAPSKGKAAVGKEPTPALRLCSGQALRLCSGQALRLCSGQALRLCSGQALRLCSGQALRLCSGQALRLCSGQALRLCSGQALRLCSGQALRLCSGQALRLCSGQALRPPLRRGAACVAPTLRFAWRVGRLGALWRAQRLIPYTRPRR